jgi:hypothetical protein
MLGVLNGLQQFIIEVVPRPQLIRVEPDLLIQTFKGFLKLEDKGLIL